MVSGSTTETEDGFISPCKLKFTQYKNPVTVEICIDAGNKPRVVSSTTSLVSVEYLISLPNGFPCARVKYQYFPLGSTVSPCGPSFSVG